MINYARIILFVASFILAGCVTNRAQNNTFFDNENQKIRVKSQTRGLKKEITLTSNHLDSYKNGDLISSKEISDKDINKLKELFSKIDLSKLNSYKAKSKGRYLDKALSEVLIIEDDNKIYKSVTYDSNNPPDELKEIIETIKNMGK